MDILKGSWVPGSSGTGQEPVRLAAGKGCRPQGGCRGQDGGRDLGPCRQPGYDQQELDQAGSQATPSGTVCASLQGPRLQPAISGLWTVSSSYLKNGTQAKLETLCHPSTLGG